MCKAKKERRQVLRGTSLVASSVLLSTILLAGCASVGDALNPVEWYKGVFGSSDNSTSAKENPPDGSEFPKISNDKRPDVSSNKERAELSKGLAADHANAKYTQDVLRREGNPTQPLSVEASIAPKVTETPASASAPSAAVISSAAVSSSVLPKQPAAASAPSAAVPAAAATPAAVPEAAPAVASEPIVAPTPSARPKQEQGSVAAPQTAPDVAALPAKPTVDVDDTQPPPPPPNLSAGGAVPAPAAAVASPVQTAASVPVAPVPAPAPAPASASAPTSVPAPAPAPVQVASATPAMTAPAAAPPAAASVEEVYRRRLAEFTAAPAAAPAVVPSAAMPAAPAAIADADQKTVLISPAEYRRRLAHDNGGARPLEAFDGSHSAASFEVAAVRFGEGTAELSAGEQQHLKDVVTLYREKGGSVRIFGRSASPRLEIDAKANQLANRQLAGGRAAAIARELVKMGVPAHKIFAGVAPGVAQVSAQVSAANGEATEIYIDY